MSDNIELRSFCTSAVKSDDIEEYHEVTQDISETNFSPKYSIQALSEYDFFTKEDVKVDSKGKKKSKRKARVANLMDIISSELASITVPIRENVITVDESLDQHENYLEKYNTRTFFSRTRSDFEHGWGKVSMVLNPEFPRVFQSAATFEENIDFPIQYTKPVNFQEIIAENTDSDKHSAKFLVIEMKNIKFSHHHTFSLEKMLCVKLKDFYDEFISVQGELKELNREIKVSRETKDNLKQEFMKISPNKKDNIRFDETVRKYTEHLLLLKEKYMSSFQRKKELVHNLISLWSDIEMVREKTDVTETPYELIITKLHLDNNDLEAKWNETFDIEYSDRLDKIEFEYVNKYIQYKEVKAARNLDDSAKRKIGKPKLQIDEDAMKRQVETIVNSLIKRVDYDLFLKHDQSKLDVSKIVKGHFDFYFEIYVDDIFVCESDHFSSIDGQIFDVDCTESITVEILPRNKTVSISLCENSVEFAKQKICIRNIDKNHRDVKFTAEEFTYTHIIGPNVKTIGSGHNIKEITAANNVRLKSSNLFKGNLYTTCKVNMKIGWDENLNIIDEDLKSHVEIGAQITRLLNGIDKPDIVTMQYIINKLYNQEVADTVLRDIMKNNSEPNGDTGDTFPIDERSPELIRLKLLHLRNYGGFTNVEDKMIPLHASQISTEQLNCLQNKSDNDSEVQYYSEKYSEMDPIELQRFIGTRYVQKLNKNMLINLNEHLLKKTHKDVVRDFKDLTWRSLFSTQSNLAALANISSSTKQQLLKDALVKNLELKVTVYRAFNLLDRRTAVLEEEYSGEQIAGFKVRPLRPFVRISYRGTTSQTSPAIGCHPTWNQTVKMEFRPEPLANLQINVYDEQRSQVSDEGSENGRPKSIHYKYYNKWLGTIHVPLKNVLTLGTVRGVFKLSTPPIVFGYENTSKDTSQSLVPEIIQLMKKESSFLALSITSNLSHLGGFLAYNLPTNHDDDYLIKHLNNFVTEYVNDFQSRNISLTFIDSSGRNKCITQFLQPIVLPDYEYFPKNPKSARAESALSKSSGFSKSSSSRSSSRKREDERQEEKETLFSNEGNWANGESQLSCLINAALRYVALIPTYEVTESHNVTLLGLELLKVLNGSPLDHTILLGSYFLYLGIKCYVAIGVGLPRGQSSYVLTKYDLITKKEVLQSDVLRSRGLLTKSGYAWHVYDATNGERTELRDVGCPLKTIDYVFDNDNIWVNIQSHQDCENVSFDFSRSSDWQQVFDKSVFVMKLPIVTDSTLYSPPTDVERLRVSLETKIRDKIQKWRPLTKTIWNRYCSSLLREMLPQWEYWALHPSQPKPAPGHRLKQLMLTYKMFGFPLNLPYANTKAVIAAVKASSAHAHDDPNAEYGLAVDVYAYPNNVISVWVFIATISRI